MDFNEIINQLKESLIEQLGDYYSDLKKETKDDLLAFVNASKEKLERWTKLLANGDIGLDDYQWLLESQKDLLVMKGLEQAGVSKLSLGHFKNKVVKTIIDIIKSLV